jgi:hypothetical protein
LTLLTQHDDKNIGMEFSELSLPQQVAAHELEMHALRNEVHRLQTVIASLIDMLEQPASSPDFFAKLRALLIERDRIRQAGLL